MEKIIKYKIKNVDCAVCASKIEDELKKLDNVDFVALNSVDSSLQIDSRDIDLINKIVKKVEPGASVENSTDSSDSNPELKAKVTRELFQIGSVVLLFLVGIIFRDELHDTEYSIGEYLVFISAYLISGWGVLTKAVKNIFKGRIFDESFLMTIATGGAIAIHQLPEAVAVMLFYNVGEFVQGLALHKSRRSIKSLMKIRPGFANVKRNGEIIPIDPGDVQVDEIIIVKAGEKIPLDGEVMDGESFADTFTLTGESVPRRIREGDQVMAGMINQHGLLTIKVNKSFNESSIVKIMELVENAVQKKAKTEKFITKFARYYTPVIVIAALAIAVLPPLLMPVEIFSDWLYRALVVLVISCPCALVISIPLGYFGGIGGASRSGILFKGSNFLDVLTSVKTVVFDKTGTLTKGVFKVNSIIPKNGFSKDELIKYAALAEFDSNHPVAKPILGIYNNQVDTGSIKDYKEIAGLGVSVKIENKNVLAGNEKLLHSYNIEFEKSKEQGTIVYIAIDEKYAGHILISDEIRDDSIRAIKNLLGKDIHPVMLTGDNKTSAKFVAEKTGIDEYRAELLPGQKVEFIEKLMRKNPDGKIAFVGDGINDAPVLARADVGIAMGGLGSDAAVEAADVVIMEDKPSKISDAINVSFKTRKIVWQNISFAFGIKAFFIILGIAGIATMWEAVFADMGVAVLAILNATRMLK